MFNYTNISDYLTRRAFEQLETLVRQQDPAAKYEYIDLNFPTTADTDTVIQHHLNPAPGDEVYYTVVKADRPCRVYQSADVTARQPTANYLVLRSDTASARVTLCVTVPAAGLTATGIVSPAYTGPVIPPPASGHDFNVAIITGSAITDYYVSKDVAAGKLTLDGAALLSAASFLPPYTLNFTANFSGDAFQHVGFALDLSTLGDRAIVSSYDTSGIYARTNVSGGTETRTLLALPAQFGVTHDWQIVWGTTTVTYHMDGVLLATHVLAVANPLFVVASDANLNASRLVVTNLSELL